MRISDSLAIDCAGGSGPGPEQRASQRMQTVLTSGALKGVSPLVQGAAGFDEASIGGRTATADEITAALTQKFGLKVAGESGAAVAKALTSDTTSGGNPVTRGARSVGRGIKRLFGGGSNPSPKKPGTP